MKIVQREKKTVLSMTANEWVDYGRQFGWITKEAQFNAFQKLKNLIMQIGGWANARTLLMTPDQQLPQGANQNVTAQVNPAQQRMHQNAPGTAMGRFFDRARKYIIMTMLATVCNVSLAQVKANPLLFLEQAQQMEQVETPEGQAPLEAKESDEDAEMERMEDAEGLPLMQQTNTASSKVLRKEGSKVTVKMTRELWETFGRKYDLI